MRNDKGRKLRLSTRFKCAFCSRRAQIKKGDEQRIKKSDTPQNIGGQLHRGQADISEAEGQAEELTEQRQRVLHFSVGKQKKRGERLKEKWGDGWRRAATQER